MITVKVGPEAYPFVLYKELLCHHSGFFHRALNKAEKKKSSPSTITELDMDELRAVDVEVFKLFQLWLEQQELKLQFEPGQGEVAIRRMVDLYIFADRFDVQKLCNPAVDQIISCATRTRVNLPAGVIADIWNQLRSNSVLRSYFVQQYALYRRLSNVDDVESTSTLSQDFLVKVVALTFDVLTQHCYVNQPAFTLDEADCDGVRALPKRVLAKFMLMNMYTLRTFYISTGNTPLKKFKSGMTVCDYHEHADSDEKAKCPSPDKRKRIDYWFCEAYG